MALCQTSLQQMFLLILDLPFHSLEMSSAKQSSSLSTLVSMAFALSITSSKSIIKPKYLYIIIQMCCFFVFKFISVIQFQIHEVHNFQVMSSAQLSFGQLHPHLAFHRVQFLTLILVAAQVSPARTMVTSVCRTVWLPSSGRFSLASAASSLPVHLGLYSYSFLYMRELWNYGGKDNWMVSPSWCKN